MNKKYWDLFKKVIALFVMVLMVGCSDYEGNNSPANVSAPSISSENYEFLLGQYSLFTKIYKDLNDSPGTGRDVQTAYSACQNVIVKISQKQFPSEITYLRTNLVDGITQMCTGFGCSSNKSLCKSDAEATALLAQGKIKLDSFINDINSLSITNQTANIPVSTLVTPTKETSNDLLLINGVTCTLWSDITTVNVGQTKCVYGYVRASWYSEQIKSQVITFSEQTKAFYFAMKGIWTFDYLENQCVFYSGKISKVGNTPVIYMGAGDSIGICSE